MVKPDFKKWSRSIVVLNNLQIAGMESLIATALQQSFEQGYYQGTREGFIDGDKNGWWQEYEKEKAKRETD